MNAPRSAMLKRQRRQCDVLLARWALQGTGKYMRHVKLQPAQAIDAACLEELVHASYGDIVARLKAMG